MIVIDEAPAPFKAPGRALVGTPQHCWHIVTGEYPPQPGGVSDYTRLVARGLAAAGDEVHVWAPSWRQPACTDPGVAVHSLPGSFGPRALVQFGRALRAGPQPRRLLVQYVPHAYGYKAMNIGLCLWLKNLARRERIWVMFHEVCFPWGTDRPWRHTFLGAVQRIMAGLVCRSAERVFVATPEWEELIRPLAPLDRQPDWLPVPSNVPVEVESAAHAATRQRIANPSDLVLGHFGTFRAWTVELLAPILVELLRRDERRVAVLIGRGGSACAEKLCREHPQLAHRLLGTGGLEPEAAAAYLSACDLLLQPYEDGASSRRGSLMAGLALGRPTITNAGVRTGPVWEASGAARLVSGGCPEWIEAAEELLRDAAGRARLGAAAARLYRERFALERTIEVLRAAEAQRD